MLTDLGIYLIALNALTKEFNTLMNPENDVDLSEENIRVRDALCYDLSKDIICISKKINDYVRRSESASGSDEYHKR